MDGDLPPAIYLSGRVRRWHTHQSLNQTVGEHSWGVALIIALEHPNPSVNLLKAALLHDLHEYETGDITPQGKKEYSIAGDEDLFADKWLRKHGVTPPELTGEERWWLKYADKVEALHFLVRCAPKDQHVIEMMTSAIENLRPIVEKGQQL